ncbi:23S rRNA (adenine(1618)-N(6))-methyltransferase RlmF [Sphingobacterium sp. SYP-B4668]|uniref:23S rRNA (adenine(1618)-N(6))-methyltransferase RlmF n=1 Tax=Sphingobacterium sp. SYP-B4668 TaxID=2996035 RepID=UPI0022DD2EBA|nr:23S rRNA (adenine(1618)-N(6))-methyltransferase RlmF [Sphingobacterium sp. SYP-B4668]
MKMSSKEIKKTLHPRNKHISGYDFQRLVKKNVELKSFLVESPNGQSTIDFGNPKAVFTLNKTLLLLHYDMQHWEIGKNSLCPPIPGRVDYIHYVADLLAKDHNGEIPRGPKVRVLDIGTGSSLIYPILGHQEYRWSFVATDIDQQSLHHAQLNISKNESLKKAIELRFQPNKEHIFKGIIKPKEKYDLIVCNPPFYSSREDNWKSTTKKFQNVTKNKEAIPVQNFGGHANELWYEGGEKAFIRSMIYESLDFKDQLGWCTTLVSDKNNLKPLIAVLEFKKAKDIEIIKMEQGNKISRILAWRWS